MHVACTRGVVARLGCLLSALLRVLAASWRCRVRVSVSAVHRTISVVQRRAGQVVWTGTLTFRQEIPTGAIKLGEVQYIARCHRVLPYSTTCHKQDIAQPRITR